MPTGNLLSTEEITSPTLRELSAEELGRVVGGVASWSVAGSNRLHKPSLFAVGSTARRSTRRQNRKKAATQDAESAPPQATPVRHVSEEHKVLLSRFKHSLKSPKLFQQFVDSLESWLSSKPAKYRKKDIHQIKRFLKDIGSFYFGSPEEARAPLLQLLQSWFILSMQNPSVFLDFASYIVKEGSQAHGAEQGDQTDPGKPNQSPGKVRRESQRAHESLEQTHKRLLRKYGEDQFMITAHRVYEDAKGINYQSMVKNVPVKYISIGQAAEEFQIANQTLAEWVANGLLHNVTKVEHPAKPEIGIVLVEPREVAKLKEKLGEEVAEPTLITLVEAAKKYDLPYETIRTWYRSGRLSEKGREVFGTHGGGKILVAENDVVRLTNRRTLKRKPTTQAH